MLLTSSEEEVTSQQMDYRQILESMTESVIVTSADLEQPGPKIIFVNAAFERMTGWTRSEVLGRSPRFLQGPKTDKAIFETMRSDLSKGKVWRGRTVNYRKDGSEFYMQWSIVPMIDTNGEIFQYLAVQRDVSDIVRNERNLAIAQEKEKIRLREIERVNEELARLTARQKKTLDLFAKYVPEPVVRTSLAIDEERTDLVIELDVVLLFCDIRKFTSIAETLHPREVASLLNEYYRQMTAIISRYNGTINQFVGDEIFVSFGAPVPIDRPFESAVQCAKEMVDNLPLINQTLRNKFDTEIVVGIGIHYGPVVVGNLGSEDKLVYSITGDAVNTAKRIESLTKGHENVILISQQVNEHVRHMLETTQLGSVSVRGKVQPVEVYRVN